MYQKITILFLCLQGAVLAAPPAPLLEVKSNKTAIVRMLPSAESTEITRLPAGTRVPKVGDANYYYSVQLSDGNNGWSPKGNFIVVTSAAPAATTVPVTPATLLKRTDVLKIIVLDVEVGDATLIICPKENDKQDVILIDTGEKGDGERIETELRAHDFVLSLKPVTRFIVTHYDTDHIGDAAKVIPLAQMVYDHGNNNIKSAYKTAVTKPGVDRRKMTLAYQETFSGGVVVKCVAVNQATTFHPTTTPETGSSDNANSIALIVSFDGFDYFTAGDLTFSAEQSLATGIQNCDVYHVNHHGSSTTSSDLDFVMRLDPEVSVASNGRKYGHPRAVVANRLLNLGSKFFHTNINPASEAYHPADTRFIADPDFTSTSAENAEGAKGDIRVVVDPVTHKYHVLVPALPLAEATFDIEN
jgi:beta-lactamase superfamily II metal-dependent hydrolase